MGLRVCWLLLLILASPVWGANTYEPFLGEARHVWQAQPLNRSCVSIPAEAQEFLPPKVGDVQFVAQSEFSSIDEVLGGRASMSLDMPSFDVSGEVDFAREFRKREFVSSVSVIANFNTGMLRLRPDVESLSLSPAGMAAALSGSKESFLGVCGTDFLAQYHLSGAFIGSLLFTFGNAMDKMHFDARVAVEIAGVGGGSASVKTLLEHVSEQVSIKLKAIQLGGTPEKLGRALGEKALTHRNARRCTLPLCRHSCVLSESRHSRMKSHR